jgi:hypothetical protein
VLPHDTLREFLMVTWVIQKAIESEQTAAEPANGSQLYLLILRATGLFRAHHSQSAATQLALLLYVGYNIAAAVIEARQDECE